MRQYPIIRHGTAIAAGDVVHLVDGGTATTIEKQSATGDDSTEIDMSEFSWVYHTDFEHKPKNIQHIISASTTASDIMAYVDDDENVLFTIQADGAPTNVKHIYGKTAVGTNSPQYFFESVTGGH